MDLEIHGNAALVTASSSGLGKASAKALAREGADVVVNGRDEARLEAAVEEVEAVAAGEVLGLPGDISNPRDVENLVDGTVAEFGRLDHLVTSAGGPERLRPLEADDEDWYAAFDHLVMSVVRAVRTAAEHLRAGDGGTILNITSTAVKEANSRNVLSSSVRMGVVGLEKTLSRELAPEVRANAVLPGAHETPRILERRERAVEEGRHDSVQAGMEALAESVPLDRIGDPMELGDTVAFLSSPRAGYINGAAVVVDGGVSASNL